MATGTYANAPGSPGPSSNAGGPPDAGNTNTLPSAKAHRTGKGANSHPQEKAVMGKHLKKGQ